MKKLIPASLVLALFTAMLPAAKPLRADPAPIAAGELKATHDHGIVTIVPDSALANGRLLIRVVAFNRGTAPAPLSDSSVHISTVAGTPVALVPVDQLVKELIASRRADASNNSMRNAHQQDSFSQNPNSVMRDSTGNAVEGNYGGASGGVSGVSSYASRSGADAEPKVQDADTQKQIAALKAGILQTLTIAPAAAAGAQIVTEKLKFGRKDERTLKLAIDFNGEQYDFVVPVPRDL
jgi:hypothetical protein